MLAAVAAAALATPALARDGSPYVGIEGGLLIAEDLAQDVTVSDGTDSAVIVDAFTIDFKRGYDVDAIAGYDFGMFRVEGELGYKRASIDDVRLRTRLVRRSASTDDDFDISSRVSILSLMANAISTSATKMAGAAYVGVGVGRARVRFARRPRHDLRLPGHRRRSRARSRRTSISA